MRRWSDQRSMAWRSVNAAGRVACKRYRGCRKGGWNWSPNKATSHRNQARLLMRMVCMMMVVAAGVVIGQLKIVVVRMAVVSVGLLKSILTCHNRMEIRLMCSRCGECEQKDANHRQKGGAKIGKSAFLSKKHRAVITRV